MPTAVLQRDLRSVQNVASASAAQAAHAEANQDELQQLQVCRSRAVCTSIHVCLCMCVVELHTAVMPMLASRSQPPWLLPPSPPCYLCIPLTFHTHTHTYTKLTFALNCHVWLVDISHGLSSGRHLQWQAFLMSLQRQSNTVASLDKMHLCRSSCRSARRL